LQFEVVYDFHELLLRHCVFIDDFVDVADDVVSHKPQTFCLRFHLCEHLLKHPIGLFLLRFEVFIDLLFPFLHQRDQTFPVLLKPFYFADAMLFQPMHIRVQFGADRLQNGFGYVELLNKTTQMSISLLFDFQIGTQNLPLLMSQMLT
jgi:hypothetical protein